jgi:hypothetical protein
MPKFGSNLHRDRNASMFRKGAPDYAKARSASVT